MSNAVGPKIAPILESVDLAARAGVTSIHDESAAKKILIEWHRQEHVGQFRHCNIQPCHAVRRAIYVR